MSGPRIVIVGAGIAGLSAARALATDHSVVILEESERPGGRLRSDTFRGRPVDVGPDAFITRNGAAEGLCRALGLGEELIAPGASGAAIFSRGRLRPFPAGLALGVPTNLRSLAQSGIVSPLGLARAALDLLLPGRTPSDLAASATTGRFDPSVADVIGRRLGREVLHLLVDPLIGGINASDVAQLSFVASAPQLARDLAGHRSMIRALRPPPRIAATAPRPVFLGLARGLGSLIEALTIDLAQRGAAISTETSVIGLHAGGEQRPWSIETTSGSIEADGVVLAVPAWRAATLLAAVDPELALECGAIPYAGVATVMLAWKDSAVPDTTARALRSIVTNSSTPADSPQMVLPGNGVLVPRGEGHLITAATFTSSKWPRSANKGEVVVRASAGRDGDVRALALDDDELVAAVQRDLADVLGVTESPLETRVHRFPASFPQYVSGHLARVARISARRVGLRGLALCGAAYDGIGIPACVESGERAASAVASVLTS